MTHAERRESTRAALIAAGRRLFAAHGYDAVAAEQIVEEAGVTRGALYHHFDGKSGLFEAVFLEIERELVDNFPLDEFTGDDPMATLRTGVSRFLTLSLENEVQRIALIDAPSVLGWARWQEIEAAHGLGLIKAGLDAAVAAGQLKPLPTEQLSHALLGALTESALAAAREPHRKAAQQKAETALLALLDGLTA